MSNKIMTPTFSELAHLLFTENRSPQSILDEFFTEEYEAINLLPIPKSDWPEHLYSELVLPDAIKNYLDGADAKLTRPEVHAIEEALEKLYSISDPYYVYYAFASSSIGDHKFLFMREE